MNAHPPQPSTTAAYREAVLAAAWWAAQLRELAVHQTGDPWRDMVVAGTTARYYTPLRPAAIAEFETLLAQDLTFAMGEADTVRIRNDIGPDRRLLEIAAMAGIKHPFWRFPYCTLMTLRPGRVTVRRGADGEPVALADAAARQEPA